MAVVQLELEVAAPKYTLEEMYSAVEHIPNSTETSNLEDHEANEMMGCGILNEVLQ